MKWEAQAVHRENGQHHLSLPVFSCSFFLHPPLTPVTPRLPPTTTSLASKCELEVVTVIVSTRLPPPPPPSHPNASQRWFFSLFQPDSHHHYLPHVQARAGGSFFRRFDPTPTTTTSLASKREPEVVHFSSFDPTPTTTTSLAFKRKLEVVSFCSFDLFPTTPPPSRSNTSWRWFFFVVSTACHHTTSLAFKRELEVVFFRRFDRLPPLPPPLRPNVSCRWLFSTISMRLPPHHLPRVQTRAGGGFFSSFRHASHHHYLPRVQTRARGGLFHSFDMPPITPTSLASKREPEVVFFGVSTRLPPPPPSRLNASWRWCFSVLQRGSHHHHLPRIQTRAGGGPFRRFRRDVGSGEGGELDDWEGHEGGARGDDDLLVVVPQSSRQRPPLSFVRGFLLWPQRRGGFIPHAAPFNFFSFSVVSNMYLGHIL
jgi:hypothetical protein